VGGTQPGGGCGDTGIEGNDSDGESIDQVANGADLGFALASGRDEAFGKGRGRHGQVLAGIEGIGENRTGRFVVGVVSVHESDDHAGVEVDHSHSARRLSSSPDG
jgi:hypothetical protein